jgi:hypothetical protein
LLIDCLNGIFTPTAHVWWHETVQAKWRPPIGALRLEIQPHLLAAATLSVFLTVMGIGHRISSRQQQEKDAIGPYEFLDGMS